MVATQWRVVRVLEISESGTMVIHDYGWDNTNEYVLCFDSLGIRTLEFSFYAHHNRPWEGINLITVEGEDVAENKVASALLGEPITGPVAFSGVEPDNSGCEDGECIEMSELTGAWGPYLPTDVPLELVTRTNEVWLEVFRTTGDVFGASRVR